MINNSYTKTIGKRLDNYTIFSILDISYDDYFSGIKDDFILKLIKDDPNGITSIAQYVSYEDLKQLSMIIWEATSTYERRQREKKEAAGREQEAQGSGAD